MKVQAIIQARCGSTRYPNKVFAPIDGQPLLWHVVNRLTYAKKIDKIIVATTKTTNDDKIEEWCGKNSVDCFRGSENDVLNRYYMASLAFPSDVIVRITADDPFKEPSVIDRVITKLEEENLDYVTDNYPASFPEGLDCEAFTFQTLEKMEKESQDVFEREHVTQYVFRHTDQFKIGNISSDRDLSFYRWTIDTKSDYNMVCAIYAKRSSSNKGILFMKEILDIISRNPEIAKINSDVARSVMYNKKT